MDPLAIFIVTFACGSVVPIPFEIVPLGLGMLGFHPLEISLWGGLGSALGALIGYLLGKNLGRPIVESVGKYFFLDRKSLRELDGWFESIGSWTVLISRINPLVPFKIFSLVTGIFKINMKNFFIATLIGSIIRCLILASFGFILLRYATPLVKIASLLLFLGLPLLFLKLRKKR